MASILQTALREYYESRGISQRKAANDIDIAVNGFNKFLWGHGINAPSFARLIAYIANTETTEKKYE